MTDELIDDALLLIEQSFYFLHVGEFFAKIAKDRDLSGEADDIVIHKDEISSYKIRSSFIKVVLSDAYQNPNIGMFEYFVEFGAIRNICMAMVEAIRLEGDFRVFIKNALGEERFEDFYDLLSFIRNVLSHNIHSEIRLSFKDFDGTKRRIMRMGRNPKIIFSFIYAADLPNFTLPDSSYGFVARADFDDMSEESLFLDIFSMWELLMICELCFNFTQIYKAKKQINQEKHFEYF